MRQVRRKVFLSDQNKEAEVATVTDRLRPVFRDTSFLKQAMLKKAQGDG
jgi:hypothetical protein